jgi:hypothetical protein
MYKLHNRYNTHYRALTSGLKRAELILLEANSVYKHANIMHLRSYVHAIGLYPEKEGSDPQLRILFV